MSDRHLHGLIKSWGALCREVYSDLRNRGVTLALKTREIFDDLSSDMDPSQRRRLMVKASGGLVSEELIKTLDKIGRDGDPENAFRILLSTSPNARDWLKIPAVQRNPLMSQPIPVIRFGAQEESEHDLIPWDELTAPHFRRAVDVAGRCLVPLSTQLARIGKRRTTRGPKYEMLDNGLAIPRKCELSTREVAEIVCEMARLGRFDAKQITTIVRALERARARAKVATE